MGKYTKKWLFCLLAVAVCPVGFAQGLSRLRPVTELADASQKIPSVSKQLEQLVEITYRQACEAQQFCPDAYAYLGYGPSKKMRHRMYIDPGTLYPSETFLSSAKELTSYFLIRQNSEFVKALPELMENRQQILANLPTLHAEAQPILHKEPEDMAWLAGQLPNDLDYLFVGEIHFYPEIKTSIADLVGQVRKQFPNRKIMLFTEFLSLKTRWNSHQPADEYKTHHTVWHAADRAKIPVIGLEPAYVKENIVYFYKRKPSKSWMNFDRPDSVWASLEGVRQRNAVWLNVLQAYRALYPDALFIIYTGAGHLLYNEPYNLPTAIKSNHVFVATLLPVYSLYATQDNEWTSFLDKLTKGQFPQRVLYFKNPQTAHLVGFDAQFKVTVFPHDGD